MAARANAGWGGQGRTIKIRPSCTRLAISRRTKKSKGKCMDECLGKDAVYHVVSEGIVELEEGHVRGKIKRMV